MKLFVYGSLMDRRILERVIGRSWQGHYRKATLPDYIKVQPSWYPMIFKEVGANVEGLLVDNLSYDDFEELDRYESTASGLFRRTTVYIPQHDCVAEVYYNGEGYKLEDYYSPIPQEATKE